MGIRAGIMEITSEAFEQMLEGKTVDISKCEHHSLDKSWSEIHDALQQAGFPLAKVITGYRLLPDCLQTYEEFLRGDHDHYVGLASPKLVNDAASGLSSCNPPERETRYFQKLVKVYCGAASRGNALMIVIS